MFTPNVICPLCQSGMLLQIRADENDTLVIVCPECHSDIAAVVENGKVIFVSSVE